MSGCTVSEELKEKLQGFELKQTRDRMEVMRLKLKISGKDSIVNLIKNSNNFWTCTKAHEAWIGYGSNMAKAAEDALKQYMEGGVVDDNHRKYLERILADAKHAKLQNKSKSFILYFSSRFSSCCQGISKKSWKTCRWWIQTEVEN